MSVSSALYTLHNIIDLLCKQTNIDLLSSALGEVLQTHSSIKDWTLMTKEGPNPNHLLVRSVVKNNTPQRKHHNKVVNFEHGLVHWVIRHKKSLSINDITTDVRFDKKFDWFIDNEFFKGATEYIPLHTCGGTDLIGIFIISNQNFLSEKDELFRKMLNTIVRVLAYTIESMEELRSLRHEALTDHLTGLYNRRSLVAIADREIEECIRYNRRIVLMVIDIDHFKKVNDSEGHLTGDEILVNFAHVLKTSVRKLDYVMRFAGDEFVILMPDTNEQQMNEVVKRIIKNFENHKSPTATDYSFSYGAYSGPPKELNVMFSHADKAMYQQKMSKPSHQSS